MALTKKQLAVIDALQSGGHIWRTGSTYYLAKKIGIWDNGDPKFHSEVVNGRTIKAILPMLTQNGKRWDI